MFATHFLVSHLLEELCKLANLRIDIAESGALSEQGVFVRLIANGRGIGDLRKVSFGAACMACI